MKLQVGAGDAGDDRMRSGNGLVGELESGKGRVLQARRRARAWEWGNGEGR